MAKALSLQNVLVLFCILLIHYIVVNGLEKMVFSQTGIIDHKYLLRPCKDCNKLTDQYITGCLGLPSGHAEIIAILTYLLFKYKYISFHLSVFVVFLVGLQRFYDEKHTISQILVGVLIGLCYGFLYFKTGLTLQSLAVQLGFIVALTLVLLCIIDYKIYYTEIPSWVDKSLLDKIKEKQNANVFIKLYSIVAPSYEQDRFLFIDWILLEQKLDDIVNQIQSTKIQYDGVVGIKTGGAIISDYISNKLGLPNYKLKVSTDENKCNKTTMRSLKTYYDLYFNQQKKEYIVCEVIPENLSKKNIILIDESVASGGTIRKSIDYLFDEKGVSSIYATCIYTNKEMNYRNVQLHPQGQTNHICFIWPWGYDN